MRMFFSPWPVNTFPSESWSALQNAKQGSSKLVDSDCWSLTRTLERIFSPRLFISRPICGFLRLGRGFLSLFGEAACLVKLFVTRLQSDIPADPRKPSSNCVSLQLSSLDKWLSLPMFQLFQLFDCTAICSTMSGETNCHPAAAGICSLIWTIHQLGHTSSQISSPTSSLWNCLKRRVMMFSNVSVCCFCFCCN